MIIISSSAAAEAFDLDICLHDIHLKCRLPTAACCTYPLHALQRQARFDSGEYFLAKEHKRPLDGLCMTTDHATAASFEPMQHQHVGAVVLASTSTVKTSRLAFCNH
jgi:hypothetical protein